MVLVRLPLGPGRAIPEKGFKKDGFGVSGGENGCSSRSARAGVRGIVGRGLSLSLCTLKALALCSGRGVGRFVKAGADAIIGGAARCTVGPVWISGGAFPRATDTEPNFLKPRLTPLKKSPLEDFVESRSSGLESKERKDSCESVGLGVSW